MPDPLHNPLRRRLGAQLRVIRRRASLSGRQLGHRIGISQSKVSRIEIGELWPPIGDIIRWLDACYVDAAERERVLALVEAIEQGQTTVRDTGRGSLEVRATELGDLDTTAVTVREFAPLTLPAVLWTPEYGRAWLAGANLRGEYDVDAAAAAHAARAAKLREPHGPTYHLVVTETALRWRPAGAPDTLPAVWARIREAAQLPRVTVQVIPDGTPTPPPLCGWTLRDYDDGGQLAIVDTPAGQVTYAGGDAAPFGTAWQQMVEVALPPDESLTLVTKLSA